MRVFKWDDDLAVVLPDWLIDQLKLKEGDEINIIAAEASSGAGAPSVAPEMPTQQDGA